MRKIIGFLALALLLSACDDGELTVETIDLSTVPIEYCSLNDVLYQINGSEILALEIDDYEAAFINDQTLAGVPRIINLDASNKVVYRTYDGTVSDLNICSAIPAASPNVTQEWVATSGTIEITTTAVTATNATTNAITITKYNHNIVFKNISFVKPSGTQVYETFPFGTYQTTPTNLPFAFDADAVQQCPSTGLIYNFSGSEALTLSIAPTLYPNVVGVQTGIISATNKATYTLYNGGLTSSYFCTTPAPTTPTINEQWIGVDGVSNVSGIIEVTTTTESASSYRHYIRLKKVSFKKGNSTFYFGDDFEYGSFVTN